MTAMIAMIAALIPVLAPVVASAGVGYVWARSRHPFDLGFVTRLVTYVGSPCLVFSTLTRFHVPAGEIIGQAGLAMLSVFACGLVGGLALYATGRTVRPLLPTVMLPNAGNLGLPIAYFAFGDEGLALALPFSAAMTLLQFTVGVSCASGHSRWTEILKTPTIYAILLAIAFAAGGIDTPRWLANATELLGGVTLPLMLIALGVSLASLRIANLGHALWLAGLRLVLGLAAGYGVVWLADIPQPAAAILILQSAMPPAVFNYLFAARYGGPVEEVAGAVVVGTIISLLTLPVLLAVLMG
ncbi:AEC family transporter [Inquilinus sp. YAF38]|uniref:AEC family transporter n=1 Tax=Inquilinus sp. YAF38 TaxID=3233084 RepID=UPI003F8EB256